MKSQLVLFALLSCLGCVAAACAAPTADDSASSSESALGATRWQAMLRCDDGSVLDVNADERRELQFVVRNDDAKRYLMQAYDSSQFDWNISPGGEVVFRGRVEHGIFYPQDFSRAVAISGRPKVQVGDEWGPTVEITRTGTDIHLQTDEYHDWYFRNCH